ncbi:MAG: MucB/RseB C-terminal domain-containing protein [Methylophaga sp.]|nr:MucB/RseB C-terminal domain-containing protein [Methylophaga sp.]
MYKVWAFCLMLLMPVLVWAENDAMALLERMTQAGKELNYQGVFAYQTGRTLQSIQIFHRNNADGESERLMSLNGPAREVIRSNDMVTCINPEGKQINISRRPLGRGFPSDLPRRVRSATPFYDLIMGDEERIAGRMTQALAIKPIDEYRYGYRLWVDKETDLLLKSELLADNGDVLETFAFSAIETDVDISNADLKPQTNGEEMTWHQSEPGKPVASADNQLISNWNATWLPEGFSMVASQNRLRAPNGSYVEQRVYSDGLSSVSIFIERIKAHHNHLHGGSHMGAVNAFGTIIHSHFVTVVGEVPAITVEKIGAGIEFNLTGVP